MKKITPEDLRTLTDVSADPVDRAESLARLTHWEKGKYDHLEPTIASLLRDPSATVRGAAIKTLLGWGREKYMDAAIQMLRSDEGEDGIARSNAAFALAAYAQHFGERDRIVREMVSSLRNDPEWSVQEKCYELLLSLVAPHQKHTPGYDPFDRDRDVDWELLRPWRPQ